MKEIYGNGKLSNKVLEFQLVGGKPVGYVQAWLRI